jgi:nucleoid-associated protein YgaU
MSDAPDVPNPLKGGKIAGMPRAVAIIGLGTVIGLGYYFYKKKTAGVVSGSSVATTPAPDGSTTNPYASATGGGGNPAMVSGVSSYATDAQWASAAVDLLDAQPGAIPTDISNAIAAYLNGSNLTAAQNSIINRATQALGAPPQGIVASSTVTNATPAFQQSAPTYVRFPDGTIAQYEDGSYTPLSYAQWVALGSPKYKQTSQSFTSVSHVTAAQLNASQVASQTNQKNGAGTGGTLYTVQLGDTLQSIANRFYGNANDWQAIWNANKTILPNPDVLYTGRTLVIPTVGQ